jgi:hypothetical protein
VCSSDLNGSRIYEEIANSVASVYNWKDYYLPEIKKVIEVNGPVLDKYVGKYDAEGTTVTITKSENGLLVNVYGDVIWKVYFTSDSDFFIREFRGSLKFKTGSDNKVAGISLNGKLAKKIE